LHLDGTLNNPRDTDRAWTLSWRLPWKALGELRGALHRHRTATSGA
jgi:hypothetical protein